MDVPNVPESQVVIFMSQDPPPYISFLICEMDSPVKVIWVSSFRDLEVDVHNVL